MYFAKWFDKPVLDVAVEYVSSACTWRVPELLSSGYRPCPYALYALVTTYRLDMIGDINPPTFAEWYQARCTYQDTAILTDEQTALLVAMAWAYSELYVRELMTITKQHVSAIEQDLIALMVLGLVETEGDNTYGLTPAGSRIVTMPLWASMDAEAGR